MAVITSFGGVLLTGSLRLSAYGRQSSMMILHHTVAYGGVSFPPEHCDELVVISFTGLFLFFRDYGAFGFVGYECGFSIGMECS